MPKKIPLGRPFKRGQTGNPNGSSQRARELKRIRSLSTREVAEVGTLLLENNRKQLRELAESDDKSFLQVWTAALMMKGYAKGNPQIYSVIMDRIIGKPKEMRELSGPDGSPINVQAIEQTHEEKLARAEQLSRLRSEVEKKNG